MSERHRFVTVLTLSIILISSLLTLWLAYTGGVGVYPAYLGVLFNALFALFLWQGKPWARKWLIGRYIASLGYALVLIFYYDDLLAALFEIAAAGCALTILFGSPTMRRAYVTLGAYVVVLMGVGVLFVSSSQQVKQRRPYVAEAQFIDRFESRHKYAVELEGSPWRVLSSEQAAHLLGADPKEADVKLVRDDGSSFGLFFPLTFSNIDLTPALSDRLESEIRQKWQGNLSKWKRYPQKDGFILTAKGSVDGQRVSYALLYKHFGNLGVYAVFWSDQRRGRRLLSDVQDFYENISAPPIKERLTKYSPGKIYQTFSDSVVLISVFDGEGKKVGQGTGFNLASQGILLTNLHVILLGRKLEVTFPNGKTFNDVKVIGLSPPQYDLALLSLDGSDLPAVTNFRTVPVTPGDVVYVLGNPKGLVNSLSQGIVGAVRDVGDLTLYQITAPISSGSSGGPVFNEFGEVIGVANSVVVDAQNLNFSISIDEMKNLYLFPQPMSLNELMDKLQD